MTTVVDVVTAALLLIGSGLALIASVGMFRMPDTYSRIHVATKPATLAVVCTVSAAVLQMPTLAPTTKLVLAVTLQFWTAPVASHMLGRAAHTAGLRPDTRWELDDLADADARSGADVEPGVEDG